TPTPPMSYGREYDKILRPIGAVTAAVIAAAVIYGAVNVVAHTPAAVWTSLLAQTPHMLKALLYDYGRVAAVSSLAMAVAVTLGYYLATRHKVERIVAPAVQVFAAYPAPVYFPIIFSATYPLLYGALGYYANELYVILLGFISTFYYVFYSFWMGLKAMPHEVWELMDNLRLSYWKRMRHVIIPAAMPYLIAGLSSTINSAWGGLAIGEYWPDIVAGRTLEVHNGLMRLIVLATNSGDIALASWASLIFGIVVVLFSVLFTKRLMDLARGKYIVEEAIYAA
ncbi:MAG: ABC transporter permease subunit, partial [Thermoproteus sp.]|nr:ABC transporter permease subunit [Thermoproteus sp.]